MISNKKRESGVCSRHKFGTYWFVKKQLHRVFVSSDDSCEESCNSNFSPWFGHCKDTLRSDYFLNTKYLVSSKISRLGRWAPKHTRCYPPFPPWCDTNIYVKNTVRPRIRARWLVSRCGICSLRSFKDWFVATTRRLTTILYTQRIRYLKSLYPRTTETCIVFGRWSHKICRLWKSFFFNFTVMQTS